MSSITTKGVSVKILDKAYTINCPAGTEANLKSAADYVDQHMRKISRSGRVVGLDKIAVMAALNIAHELISTQAPVPATETPNINTQTLEALHRTIDDALKAEGLEESEEIQEHALEVEY